MPSPFPVQTARGTVECVDHGQGPAVLAVHGGMGGWDQGVLLARALFGDAPPLRVIAPSRPGYLGTPLAGKETPEAQADLFAALLDQAGVERALVCAVSAGGPSALLFALRHPERCAGLVLVSTCTGRLELPPNIRRRLPLMRLLVRIPGLAALMRRRAASGRSASRSISSPELRARTLAHPEAGVLFRALQVSVFERMADRLAGTANDMARFDVLAPIPMEQVAVPVLAIHGTADPVVAFDHGRRAAETIPGAELMAVEAGEHVVLFTHLDAVRERTARFARRIGWNSIPLIPAG